MKSLDTAPITERERAAIREAARILKDQFPVEEVILFGSKARGDFDEESDIDLLVLTSRRVDWREHDSMIDCLFELQLENDVVISLFIQTAEEWLHGIKGALPIKRAVDREGISV